MHRKFPLLQHFTIAAAKKDPAVIKGVYVAVFSKKRI